MKRANARAKDLGESWGNLEYAQDDDVGHVSSAEDDASGIRITKRRSEQKDRATPLSSSRAKPSSRSGAAPPPTTPASRRPRPSASQATSVEPEFFMPSPEGSWVHSPPRASHLTQRTPRVAEEEYDFPGFGDTKRRRSTPMSRPERPARQNTSPSIWDEFVYPAFRYLFSILADALGVLRPVFSLVVAALVLLTILLVAKNHFTDTIYAALMPVCYIPGISFFNVPFCGSKPAVFQGPVEFDELMTAQSAFEEVLTYSVEGEALHGYMRRSETVIRDLRQKIMFAPIASRNELESELGGFIDTARQASQDLARFNSRIGHAVDLILLTNRWTLRVLDNIVEREEDRGSITRFVWDTLLQPLAPQKTPRAVLVQQYVSHTRAIEDQIAQLIVRAEALLGCLETLDDRLDAIHEITIREDMSAKEERDEFLALLWTKIGGNRGNLERIAASRQLLRDVNKYRRTAVAHVSATVIKLQAIAADLENLRERAATPEITGGDVPITLHIESMKLGVERLEEQRKDQRAQQKDAYRRAMDGDVQIDEGRLIE